MPVYLGQTELSNIYLGSTALSQLLVANSDNLLGADTVYMSIQAARDTQNYVSNAYYNTSAYPWVEAQYIERQWIYFLISLTDENGTVDNSIYLGDSLNPTGFFLGPSYDMLGGDMKEFMDGYSIATGRGVLTDANKNFNNMQGSNPTKFYHSFSETPYYYYWNDQYGSPSEGLQPDVSAQDIGISSISEAFGISLPSDELYIFT